MRILIILLQWSKADQEEKEESKERDPMNRPRCQDAESKEGGRMKGVPYSER